VCETCSDVLQSHVRTRDVCIKFETKDILSAGAASRATARHERRYPRQGETTADECASERCVVETPVHPGVEPMNSRFHVVAGGRGGKQCRMPRFSDLSRSQAIACRRPGDFAHAKNAEFFFFFAAGADDSIFDLTHPGRPCANNLPPDTSTSGGPDRAGDRLERRVGNPMPNRAVNSMPKNCKAELEHRPPGPNEKCWPALLEKCALKYQAPTITVCSRDAAGPARLFYPPSA